MSLVQPQAISVLKVCQPAIAQHQSFVIRNPSHVCECIPFLMDDFASQENVIGHRV